MHHVTRRQRGRNVNPIERRESCRYIFTARSCLGKVAPMAARSTLVEMMRTLGRSGLMSADRVDEITHFLEDSRHDGDTLASALVQRGWLNDFQAHRLVEGKLVLGTYVLLELLGEGGMGEVYKARHLLLDRLVALKVIRRDQRGDVDLTMRFKREMKLAASLHHPNVVQVFDADEVDGTLFYTMEYLAGRNLAKVVSSKGPLEPARACAYLRQAALGLQQAHDKGLVHRDVKPSNMMLVPAAGALADIEDGVIKMLDLGLAFRPRAEPSDADTLTGPSATLGTADYMAPEQGLDSHAIDSRADIYSLGCTLYFLLTGRPPFPGGTPNQKYLRHLQSEPDKIEDVCVELPRELPAVLRKMMAKKPDERYQSAAEVATALEPLSSTTRSTQPFTPADLQPTPSSVPTQLYTPPPRMRSSRRPMVLLLIAILFIGGALALWLLLRPRSDPPLPGQWIVSRTAEGENVFPTIRAALDKAKPGDRILVRDENHEEHLVLLHGERGRGVTIEADVPQGRTVTWRPPADFAAGQPLIHLGNVDDFCLKGFVLDGVNKVEHLVALHGAHGGTRLDGLHLRGFTHAAVRLKDCEGIAKQPVTLGKLVVVTKRETASAIVIEGSRGGAVDIRDCIFAAPLQSGIRVAAPTHPLRVSHNRFFQTKDSIVLDTANIPPSARLDVTLASNTFHSVGTGLRVQPFDLFEKDSRVEVTNNLFARTGTLADAQRNAAEKPLTFEWTLPPAGLSGGPWWFGGVFQKKGKLPDQVMLELHCDDVFQAWWNDVHIGDSKPGQRFYRFDITKQVAANADDFERPMLRCENPRGLSGFHARIVYDFGQDRKLVYPTFLAGSADKNGPPPKDRSNMQPVRTVNVAPLRVTGFIGNIRDAASREGALSLGSTVMDFSFRSVDPTRPGEFLLYQQLSPLMKAGAQGQPVGRPPD
jgi:serine/threonine protein kinase